MHLYTNATTSWREYLICFLVVPILLELVYYSWFLYYTIKIKMCSYYCADWAHLI